MEKWQIFIQEASTQVEFAKRSYADFQNAKISGVVMDVFFHLHHFVIHATSIDKILDPQLNKDRCNILASHIDMSGIDLKPLRRLRNHLEHFDERLDRWVSEYDGHAFFDMNIITGAKGFPKKAFLRAIDGDTFKFHGEDYLITELYTSVIEIEHRITKASKLA